MNRKLYWAHWVLCATLAIAAAPASTVPPPPAAAEAAVTPVECQPFDQWDQARVDRAGNLWLLSGSGTELRRLSKEGRLVESLAVAASRAFDADAEWGVATLSGDGTELRIRRSGMSSVEAHPLAWEAGDVVWLSATRVAVATTKASDAVVVIESATGRPIEVLWGGEPEIRVKEGAAFLRSFHLAADHGRRRLHVLDSLGGRLRVLSLDGGVPTEAKVTATRLPGLLEWLDSVDRHAREHGSAQTPYVRSLRAAVSVAGDTYVMEACSEGRDRGTLAVIDSAGEIERREVVLPGPYCSLSFVRWNDRLVFALPDADNSWHCQIPPRRPSNG